MLENLEEVVVPKVDVDRLDLETKFQDVKTRMALLKDAFQKGGVTALADGIDAIKGDFAHTASIRINPLLTNELGAYVGSDINDFS